MMPYHIKLLIKNRGFRVVARTKHGRYLIKGGNKSYYEYLEGNANISCEFVGFSFGSMLNALAVWDERKLAEEME
jgi:hypothetical protein